MKEKYYFYSYVWILDGQPDRSMFEHGVTDRHPAEEIKEWIEEHDGNQHSRLLSFQEISFQEYLRFRNVLEV